MVLIPKSEYIYVMDTFDFYNYAARHGHHMKQSLLIP